MRVVIVPGNGGSPYPAPLLGNFYDALAAQLTNSGKFSEVFSKSMPDPNAARRSIWLPHLIDTAMVDADTIVIGHSSGAEAAMRLAETTKVKGLVLVAACHSDLGDAGERVSGWYPPSGGPWQWADIKANAGFIVQFHSTDDPFINIQEARVVAESLGSEFHEFQDRSHFFEPFPEAFDAIMKKL
ncbi:hypothetical protein TeGR_g5110 [Tetraparma gracilis]|uniref:Uncharacterized protein n=1 Tax=Tetraparma gracilis TaxID=2962635 RepID=A0ABQ6ML34_9STRA|nr:hypothetical protein TeGR_g5110 [Tetraparma gracilis]